MLQGKYVYKLLAVDVPAASGQEQRLYVEGNDRIYNRGSVVKELRDPFLNVRPRGLCCQFLCLCHALICSSSHTLRTVGSAVLRRSGTRGTRDSLRNPLEGRCVQESHFLDASPCCHACHHSFTESCTRAILLSISCAL